MNLRILNLALKNARNKIAESFYIKSHIDFTRPIQIYATINNQCNARCAMCDSWRKGDLPELPATTWINALRSLKSFSGTFHINFSGGEPFLKKDFFDILEFCHKEKISAGLTTNGFLLHERHVDRLLELNPFNINISVDSMKEEVHDSIRNIPGLLRKTKENIAYLTKRKKQVGSRVQVILKPTVSTINIRDLHSIVAYAKEMNLTGVNFQPIFKWSKEAEEMFQVDKEELSQAIKKIVEMKTAGFPILNSVQSILQWKSHFEEEIPPKNSPCAVPLRNLTILPDGEIHLCLLSDSRIGNIETDSMKEIWHSAKTKRLRKSLVKCTKICTATCLVKRGWKDYFNLFSRLIRN